MPTQISPIKVLMPAWWKIYYKIKKVIGVSKLDNGSNPNVTG